LAAATASATTAFVAGSTIMMMIAAVTNLAVPTEEDGSKKECGLCNNHLLARTTTIASCEASSSSSSTTTTSTTTTTTAPIPIRQPSWIRRTLLYSLGVKLPTPRLLQPGDPSLHLSTSALRQRQRDERKMRQLLETAKQQQQQQQQRLNNHDEIVTKLSKDVFELLYGKGVTPQQREDFLIRYGCTGWTSQVVETVIEVCQCRGLVEIGAGHGQWSRILNDTYNKEESSSSSRRKQFDFVVAYDDQSNLPLNTHVYNQYTKPHHDYFGTVRKIVGTSDEDKQRNLQTILRSWQCRGRALLLVYPPPGPMAANALKTYLDGGKENDLVVYVGEGRDGANGDDEFFDLLTKDGEWILVKEMDVLRPPGNKGYEKLFVLQRKQEDQQQQENPY
jgi:hypothetical protein